MYIVLIWMFADIAYINNFLAADRKHFIKYNFFTLFFVFILICINIILRQKYLNLKQNTGNNNYTSIVVIR